MYCAALVTFLLFALRPSAGYTDDKDRKFEMWNRDIGEVVT